MHKQVPPEGLDDGLSLFYGPLELPLSRENTIGY